MQRQPKAGVKFLCHRKIFGKAREGKMKPEGIAVSIRVKQVE